MSMFDLDFEKAFDQVDWVKLMRALRRLGVDYRDRRLIGNLYMGQSEDEDAWREYDTRTHQAKLQWTEIECTRQSGMASLPPEPADGREEEEEDVNTDH